MRKKCFLCEVINHTDKHHVIPIEYGGLEEGKTVNLCPTCHRNVHQDAEERYRNNIKYEKIYDTQSYIYRLNALSYAIFRAKSDFKQSKKYKAKNARNMIACSFSNEELAIAHDLKTSLGFKSLPRLIKYLVQEKWIQKRRLNH